MPSLSGRVSLATGAKSGNVILGSQYDSMPFDGTVEFLCFADKNLVTTFIASGPDILMEPGSAIPFGAAEAAPVYPDHQIAEDEAAEGDRLKLEFTNGNAATAIVNWQLKIASA